MSEPSFEITVFGPTVPAQDAQVIAAMSLEFRTWIEELYAPFPYPEHVSSAPLTPLPLQRLMAHFDYEDGPSDGSLLGRQKLSGEALGTLAYKVADSGKEVVLRRFWTTPAARGTGVAAALMGKLEDIARGIGATELQATTGEWQRGAVGFYEKYGFSRTKETRAEYGVMLILFTKTL